MCYMRIGMASTKPAGATIFSAERRLEVDYIVIPERKHAFNTAYWASKSPAVRKATELGIPGREEGMTALAQSGLVIDRQIDIMGYDPYETMLTRFFFSSRRRHTR